LEISLKEEPIQGSPIEIFFYPYRPTIKATFLAPVKAEKSTLINALIGSPFLPANSLYETAFNVDISHKPEVQEGLLYQVDSKGSRKKIVRGISEIYRAINSNINDHNLAPSLHLEVELETFKNLDLSFRVTLSDPSNLETSDFDPKTMKATMEAIEGSDVVVIVLNSKELEPKLDKEISELLKKLQSGQVDFGVDRILFLVNLHRDEIGPSNSRKDVAELVQSFRAKLLKYLARDASINEISEEQILVADPQSHLLASLALAPFPDSFPSVGEIPLYEFYRDILELCFVEGGDFQDIKSSQCQDYFDGLDARSQFADVKSKIVEYFTKANNRSIKSSKQNYSHRDGLRQILNACKKTPSFSKIPDQVVDQLKKIQGTMSTKSKKIQDPIDAYEAFLSKLQRNMTSEIDQFSECITQKIKEILDLRRPNATSLANPSFQQLEALKEEKPNVPKLVAKPEIQCSSITPKNTENYPNCRETYHAPKSEDIDSAIQETDSLYSKAVSSLENAQDASIDDLISQYERALEEDENPSKVSSGEGLQIEQEEEA